jgi:hypothetical protein
VLEYYSTRLINDKRPAFERCVGQQQIQQGIYYHPDYQVSQIMYFADGAQTPKTYQPPLDLWIPLIFDFNLHVERSLHIGVFNTLQAYIEISLAKIASIVTCATLNGQAIAVDSLPVVAAELYTRNVYLPQKINDMFLYKGNKAIYRTHRHQEVTLTSPNGQVLLSALKYPVEMISFSFQPVINETGAGNFTNWHRMGAVATRSVPIPSIIAFPCLAPIKQLVVRSAEYQVVAPVIDSVGFTLHGNELYAPTMGTFYGDYAQWAYPSIISAPIDTSATGHYLISFASDPGMFNPNGHYESSTAREFYLAYEGRYITSATPVKLFVSAQCINFMLYSKDSLKLKYVT